jgi:hypothetical protein
MSYNSTTITLPSGATAVIRDPRTLLVKDRKRVLDLADAETKVQMTIGMQEGLIAVMVESWSFDLIPPNVSTASLEQISPADYEALLDASMPAEKALFPSLYQGGENDPKAVIENLNG